MLCRVNWYSRDQTPGSLTQGTLAIQQIRRMVDPATGIDHSGEGDVGFWLGQVEETWNKSPGPQYFHAEPLAGSTWNYIKARLDTEPERDEILVGENTWGTTYNCNSFYQTICSTAWRPIDIEWSEVYIDPGEFAGLSDLHKAHLIAHEMGHTLGLAHHSGVLMQGGTFNDIYAPTETDLGSTTDCRLGTVPREQFGIRCIYGYYPSISGPNTGGGRAGGNAGCQEWAPGRFKCE
jgi:hypothetical protein